MYGSNGMVKKGLVKTKNSLEVIQKELIKGKKADFDSMLKNCESSIIVLDHLIKIDGQIKLMLAKLEDIVG